MSLSSRVGIALNGRAVGVVFIFQDTYTPPESYYNKELMKEVDSTVLELHALPSLLPWKTVSALDKELIGNETCRKKDAGQPVSCSSVPEPCSGPPGRQQALGKELIGNENLSDCSNGSVKQNYEEI